MMEETVLSEDLGSMDWMAIIYTSSAAIAGRIGVESARKAEIKVLVVAYLVLVKDGLLIME